VTAEADRHPASGSRPETDVRAGKAAVMGRRHRQVVERNILEIMSNILTDG